jgi:hypothetical protein
MKHHRKDFKHHQTVHTNDLDKLFKLLAEKSLIPAWPQQSLSSNKATAGLLARA